MSEPVDLRSDTVTRPSPEMRQAIVAATVGDNVYGEDPTVRELEDRVAALFGFGGAVFVPSGVMANQIGVRLLVAPGEELVCDSEAHVVTHEHAGLASHGGVQTRTVPAPDGLLDPDLLAETVRAGNHFTVGTRAVLVEQTHNRGGGTVYPLRRLRRIREVANRVGAALHIDGARVWNAHVATGEELSAYGELADTMAVSLSKGLGAPVGSLVLTTEASLADARRLRQRLGGGMRQAGLLAAAGLYALDHNIARLAEDHRNARLLAERLRGEGWTVRAPRTNIVVADVDDAPAVAERAAARGVLVSAFGPTRLRMVTHLDVDEAGCALAAAVLAEAARPTGAVA